MSDTINFCLEFRVNCEIEIFYRFGKVIEV